MGNFLHGVETVEIEKGPRPIVTVKTAIVGLIGTAPAGEVNQPVVVKNEQDAAQFGPQLADYTIPQALDAIFDQGAGTVIVINVLDPETHVDSITDESVTFNSSTDKASLSKGAVSNVVVKSTDGNTTYVLDTDYKITDALTGDLERIPAGNIPAGGEVHVSFDHLDPTAVTSTEINGTVSVGGVRSGMKALEDTYNLFGYFAKILIAPVFCTQSAVSVELIAMAHKLRAMALIDAPIGTTVSEAVAGRGPSGAINFNTSSDRAILCYPHLKVIDARTGVERLEPYSQRLAGAICRRDVEQGYWWSPSNLEILGVVGAERSISAMINDPQTEANQLNEVGIVTVFNSFGSGLRTWGNRSAAWPSVTHPRNFIAVRRTADIRQESVEYAQLQFMDYPVNNALIDAVLESANQFSRIQQGRGAVISGEFTFDPAKNPSTKIALGHLTYDDCFMPPVPNERVTFESFIDINRLAALGGTA